MSETFGVKGLSEFSRFMDQLPTKLAKNVVRGGLRAGLRATVLPAARANIHSVSGDLSKSLRVGSRTRYSEVQAYLVTRVFYAKFVEYGTKPHTIAARDGGVLAFGGGFARSVQHPGARAAMSGMGFLRSALDSQARAAVLAAGGYMKLRLATKHGLDTSDINLEAEEP